MELVFVLALPTGTSHVSEISGRLEWDWGVLGWLQRAMRGNLYAGRRSRPRSFRSVNDLDVKHVAYGGNPEHREEPTQFATA